MRTDFDKFYSKLSITKIW